MPAGHAQPIPPAVTPYFALVEKTLNDAFAQACVRFARTQQVPEIVSVDYDESGNDTIYVNDPQGNRPHYTALYKNSAFKEKFNLAVAQNIRLLGASSVGGISQAGEKVVFIPVANMVSKKDPAVNSYRTIPHTCAHETGHFLRLSTRGAEAYSKTFQNHDPGPFPPAELYPRTEIHYESLMTQRPQGESLWLRHEDWIMANNTAAEMLMK